MVFLTCLPHAFYYNALPISAVDYASAFEWGPALARNASQLSHPLFTSPMSRSVGLFWFCGAFWFVWVPFLAVGVRSFDVIDLELAALLLWSLYALVACRASLPCSSCFTCSVWTLSHSFHSLQRLLVVLVFFVVVVGFWVVVVFLVGLVWCFVVFVLPLPLCMPSILSFTDWCIAHRQQSREQKNCIVQLLLVLCLATPVRIQDGVSAQITLTKARLAACTGPQTMSLCLGAWALMRQHDELSQ